MPHPELIARAGQTLDTRGRDREASGRMDDTMIVVTSDHGDHLGDHRLGEKNLVHAPPVRSR